MSFGKFRIDKFSSISKAYLNKFTNMSSPSYMTRETLAELLGAPSPNSIAVIDVRDEDHVGGHIKGSQNIPSTTLDYRMPELVRTLKDKEKVVFHCALSQQRGPSAARMYLREQNKSGSRVGESEDGASNQEVFILEGGFTQWQQKQASLLNTEELLLT